jgi:hypothetical protein
MTDEIDHITEARRLAMRTIDEYEYLNDGELYGTLHEIVNQLAKAEAKAKDE